MARGDDETPQPEPSVGFGRPPKKHQFKKGSSGNPKGRPKKVKVPTTSSLDFGTQPANAILLEEAYRPVSIREGDETIRLPAIQAVFRAMGVAAIKGNRFAQRTMAELVQKIEDEDRKLRGELMQTAIDYKCGWEHTIEQARERGQPEPQPVPHPDDIIIDLRAPGAFFNGPSTKAEKAAWDKLLAHRDDLQQEVSYSASNHRKSRSPNKKARAREMWLFEQKLYDRINDNLPERYRKELADRSWDPDATGPGEMQKRVWPGEQPMRGASKR